MEVRKGYKHTEVGVIPEDWNISLLENCTSRITDGEHLTPKRSTNGYYLLSARNIHNGRVDLSDVDYVEEDEFRRIRLRCSPEPGDVLISCSGTVGRIATVPEKLEFVMVRSAALVKPSPPILSGKFAQYFLQSHAGQKQIFASLNQGAQANLFLNHIKSLRIALPPTKAEQVTISEVLSDADALIDSLEQFLAKKRQLKQGALQELLTGQRRLPAFRGEWGPVVLQQLGKCHRGVSYNPQSDLSPFDTASTVRLLRSSNVQDGKIVLLDVQYVNSRRVSSDQRLRAGDVLICMANGSRDLVGKAGRFRVTDDGREYTFGAFMGCFRPNGNAADPDFVSYIFQTEEYRSHIALLLAGSSINNLSPSSVKALVTRIPPDKAEQTAIAAILSDMETEIAALEAKLAKARQLKQGMMQELLTGRIRLV